MKKLLLAVAALLLIAAPVTAHAQCATSNTILTYGGAFSGYSTTINPGDETFVQYEVQNTNPVGLCPITYCIQAFQASTPGRPTPNYMGVFPSPSAPACQTLVGGGNFIAVEHWTTLASDGSAWVIYHQTPPFKYLITTQIKVSGALVAQDMENLNVLDPWGNTVQH